MLPGGEAHQKPRNPFSRANAVAGAGFAQCAGGYTTAAIADCSLASAVWTATVAAVPSSKCSPAAVPMTR